MRLKEILEEKRALRQLIKIRKRANKLLQKGKLLLIEDGSVDTELLDKYGIQYIIYRQGSTPPRFLK